MTQEQKELLLRDLCARLPYGVKVQSYSYEEDIETIETLREIDSDGCMSTIECDTLKNILKPYLFPLSSMTEEQYKIYWELEHSGSMEHLSLPLLEWLYKNHFDVNGLIPLNLANDATNLNIY